MTESETKKQLINKEEYPILIRRAGNN